MTPVDFGLCTETDLGIGHYGMRRAAMREETLRGIWVAQREQVRSET